MKLTTPAAGAAAERQAILRYIRRRRKTARLVDALDLLEIEQWILARKASSATRSY